MFLFPQAAALAKAQVVIRTSGTLTWRLQPCYADYIDLLRQRLATLADLHLLVDISMWLPDGLSYGPLRSLSDEHERLLARRWDAVRPFV